MPMITIHCIRSAHKQNIKPQRQYNAGDPRSHNTLLTPSPPPPPAPAPNAKKKKTIQSIVYNFPREIETMFMDCWY